MFDADVRQILDVVIEWWTRRRYALMWRFCAVSMAFLVVVRRQIGPHGSP
jgi:hypothetical protein